MIKIILYETGKVTNAEAEYTISIQYDTVQTERQHECVCIDEWAYMRIDKVVCVLRRIY